MRTSLVATCAGLAAALGTAAAAPQYEIIDLGVVDSGDFASQGVGVSSGGVVVGRSVGVSNRAFSWTRGGGLVALDALATRTYHEARAANDSGLAVGVATSTPFGSGALPVLWNGTSATQLDLASIGQTVGRANGINSAGTVVGSAGGGISERGVIWQNGTASVITATTAGGAFMTTAYAINDAGLVAGIGVDPNNAARNVALVYDSVSGAMTEIPALAGDNGGLAFNIGSDGSVVGSGSFNQAGGTPFIWDAVNGTRSIDLPADTSSGSARGVNGLGWVVGNAGGLFSVPWLFDGTETFRLQDLIDPASGWDLSMNTSSSALGVALDGTIVGTGIFNGETRAYAMILIPAPAGAPLLAAAGIVAARRRRR